jgi:hypothetical protein
MVYVVVGGWDYEPHDMDNMVVCGTADGAEEAKAKLEGEHNYDEVLIYMREEQ